MSLLEKTKSLLRANRITPNRFLGQNFMVEPSVFETLIDYASVDKNDTTLDIGAGLGFLTRLLAERCRTVLAVEADPRLVSILQDQLEHAPNVEIMTGSVLRLKIPSFDKVVSIPPYKISSQLLLWLFKKHPDCSVLIFQREFTDRLVATANSEYYGWLAVLAYYYVEVEVFDDIPKSMFYPQPKVDSVIVRLKPRRSPPFAVKDDLFFKQLVRLIFTQRNRKVRNALLPFMKKTYRVPKDKIVELTQSLPSRDRRVRELAPEEFGELADALSG